MVCVYSYMREVQKGAGDKEPIVLEIGPNEDYVKAQMRDYQVAIHWFTRLYI